MSKFNKIPDSFQAFLVEGAHFTKEEEYPILETRMISTEVPRYVMPFNKAINYKGDLSDTFICFYAPDATFERVRRQPKRYLPFFRRTAGIIGFDFSVHSNMPVVKQKAQMNDNISLMYYFGKHGIPIIPNIRCGIDELLPEYLQAFPKGTIIAVGTHGFIKERREKCEWLCFLEEVNRVVHPSKIVVCGPLSGDFFKELKSGVNIIEIPAWIDEDKRRRDQNEY